MTRPHQRINGPGVRALFAISDRGWAFDNIATALALYAPDGCELVKVDKTELQDLQAMRADYLNLQRSSGDGLNWNGARAIDQNYDVAVVMWWREMPVIRETINARRYVLCVYDEVSWCNPGKDGAAFLESVRCADLIACASERIRAKLSAWLSKAPYPHRAPPLVVLPDGVDTTLFHPGENEQWRKSEREEDFTVGWCGNTKAHHGGQDFKGVGIIREAARLAGVKLLIADKGDYTHHEMPEKFYAKIHAYVCMSEAEGTPNPVLEAVACGVPVITTRVGITDTVVIDKAEGVFVDRDLRDLVNAIQTMRRNRWQYKPWTVASRIARHDWSVAAARWWDALGDLTEARRMPVDVDAFVFTMGEPSTAQAIMNLSYQDEAPRLVMVSNVRPMSAAFGLMSSSDREWVIQVDSDMLLRPGAVRDLMRVARGAGPETAMVIGWLWDDYLALPIQGIKAYRTRAIKQHGWSDVFSCEMEQIDRLVAGGWRIETLPRPTSKLGCCGTHYGCQTPEMTYNRIRRLVMKMRQKPKFVGWVDPWIRGILSRTYRPTRINNSELGVDEINDAAYAGVIAGLQGPLDEREDGHARGWGEIQSRLGK